MQTTRLRIRIIHSAISCAAVLVLCGAPSAWAQDKQKISYRVTAENCNHMQRNTIDVGDKSDHQLTLFEIHRTFPSNAPAINGVKLKETWTRGYADYINSNGLSTNYTVYMLDNGDKFSSHSSTMGHADAAGKRTTIAVGQSLGGTGKFSAMKGLVRSAGASEGKAIAPPDRDAARTAIHSRPPRGVNHGKISCVQQQRGQLRHL